MIPFVSVVMPTLNARSSVAESLRSVLEQTWRALEVVVMDGGSTDGTVEIVSAIACDDSRVRLFVAKDDGLYDAMNRGTSHARGSWLYFLGSDDVLASPDVLERVAARAHEGNVLYGNVRVVGDTPFAAHDSIYDGPFSVQKLFQKNICHQSVFYRKEFIDEEIGPFVTRFPICADWDFNLRCRAKTAFVYLDLVIANFRAGGLSTRTHDHVFANGLVARSLRYFDMSSFDPVAQKGFVHRPELRRVQREENLARFVWMLAEREIRSFRTRARRKLASWF